MIWLWTIFFRGNSFRAYNVGSEEASVSPNSRAATGSGSARTPVHIAGKTVAGATVARYVSSKERIQQELGLHCTISLGEAVKRTADWNRAQCPRELQNQ